jgi:hypothetical protein
VATIFRPFGTDNPATLAAAGRVEVVRELGPSEADAEEVGQMFLVRNLATGAEAHAFLDELHKED